MLEIAEPDDAGFPMRGTVLVAGREPLQAKHPHAPAGELIERRAAGRAEAADHDIETVHVLASVTPQLLWTPPA